MDVPQARQIAAPSWVNARTVVGLLIFAAAFVGGQKLVADARATALVWAAARDLPQNTTLALDDLRLAEVRLSNEQLARYMAGSRPLAGAVLTRPVLAGELVPAQSVASERDVAVGRSMTIPVSAEHAPVGYLRAGDRIDVIATFGSDGARPRTTAVIRDVGILDVVTAGGLVAGEESVVGVTVAVTPEQATRLAFVIRTAQIDISVVEGPPGTGDTSTVQGGDL